MTPTKSLRVKSACFYQTIHLTIKFVLEFQVRPEIFATDTSHAKKTKNLWPFLKWGPRSEVSEKRWLTG